jgi:hypothetical protein
VLSTTFCFGAIKPELGIVWITPSGTGFIPLSRVQVNRNVVGVGSWLETVSAKFYP